MQQVSAASTKAQTLTRPFSCAVYTRQMFCTMGCKLKAQMYCSTCLHTNALLQVDTVDTERDSVHLACVNECIGATVKWYNGM